MIAFLPRSLFRDILAANLEEGGATPEDALVEADRQMQGIQFGVQGRDVVLLLKDGEVCDALDDAFTTRVFNLAGV